MKTLKWVIYGAFLGLAGFAEAGDAYLKKFQQYIEWSNDLPTQPTPEYIEYIDQNTPLTNKLRHKWLYKLAQERAWELYSRYYQKTDDLSLQCYALTALYYQGKSQQALKEAIPLWLSGASQPQECNELFKFLLKDPSFDESLITKRIELALEKRNLSLARYLLKQYKTPRSNDVKELNLIYRNPTRITQLDIGELHDDYYLYGLKRMVSINMDQAIRYWQHVKTNKLLNESQQQSFLAHLALYKAMRNHPDTPKWFAKVKPAYYYDALLEWQIRFALKHHRWHEVETLIHKLPDQDEPCWQYWLARSLEQQGNKAKAKSIYEQLASIRNYYGFLASLRIHKTFNFENENPMTNMELLAVYKPVLEQIKTLYTDQNKIQASRYLNDFVLELPKEERSALAYWLANELQWYGKSLQLSNNESMNNQISLRFPLAHQAQITQEAKKYHIPKAFIYAIIRQESTFRDEIVSSAGAHGLMQVMPATAKNTASRAKIDYKHQSQLFDPQKNIKIGTAYLDYLSDQFNHHPLLMAAAYNAGPKQASYWLKNHPPKQIDIWIETLPWHETRNYLKNVIAFVAVYQYRLQQKPDLSDFLKPLSMKIR